jgi:flagellar motor switch protein FliN/FliY
MAENNPNLKNPAGKSGAVTGGTPAGSSADSPVDASGGGGLTDTEKMVKEVMAEAEASVNDLRAQVDGASPMSLPDLAAAGHSDAPLNSIELLSDVELNVMVELGRTQMLVEDVLRLAEGSVVELDKLAGDPVDVYVNKQLVARGEVLVLNDNFCIRISEIVSDLEDQDAPDQAAAQATAK